MLAPAAGAALRVAENASRVESSVLNSNAIPLRALILLHCKYRWIVSEVHRPNQTNDIER